MINLDRVENSTVTPHPCPTSNVSLGSCAARGQSAQPHTRIVLMDLVKQMNSAPRCSAASKRSRPELPSPGGASLEGIPVSRSSGWSAKGKANEAWKHCRFTAEAITVRRLAMALMRRAQGACEAIVLPSCDPTSAGKGGRHLIHLGRLSMVRSGAAPV